VNASKPNSILIIGNQGYIGPVLARALRTSFPSSKIYGLDTGLFAASSSTAYSRLDSYVDVQLCCDIRTADLSDLPEVDCIMYLAAISNDPMGNEFSIPTMEINCAGALRVAEFYRAKHRCVFIYASSCSVYGEGGENPRTESDPVNPLSAYARSKVQAESFLSQLAGGGLSVICLRFATACGVSPRLRLDLVLNDFVASSVLAKRIEILSDGTPWRPIISVRDMADAFIWASRYGLSGNDGFLKVNVGFDGWNFRVSTLAQTVSRVLGEVEVCINSSAAPDRRSYQVDFSLYRRLSGKLEAMHSIENEILDLANAVRKLSFNEKSFRDSHFIRLNVLREHRANGLISESLNWQ